MMKYLLLSSLFVYFANAFYGKDCESGADCREDQCCFSFDSKGTIKKCSSLIKPGHLCAVGDSKDDGLTYHGACPCAKGYVCRFGKDSLPKCRMTDERE